MIEAQLNCNQETGAGYSIEEKDFTMSRMWIGNGILTHFIASPCDGQRYPQDSSWGLPRHGVYPARPGRVRKPVEGCLAMTVVGGISSPNPRNDM
jgi:hypothetical protein